MIITTPPAPTRLERLFRFSSYLTLFLACACLVWSEVDILTDVIGFAAVLTVLLVVAYLTEGRWSLSIKAANLCGALIAAFVGLWAAYKLLSPPPDSPLANMFPTNILPLLGPLLLMLLPAKLLRPKAIADHWGLQGIGIVCVGLACALVREDDLAFPCLMMIYLISALWCLALFFLYRERRARPVARQLQPPRPPQLIAWAVPILGVAMLGFLTLPRTNSIWQVPRQEKKLESGSSEETGIDLNRTGTLTLDPEVAFEVHAQDRFGAPKLDIPADQRWRGPVYRRYFEGKWGRVQPPPVPFLAGVAVGGGGMPTPAANTFNSIERSDRFTLTFTIKSDIGRVPFLADPLYRPGNVIPVVTLHDRQDRPDTPWLSEHDSMLYPRTGSNERLGPKGRYRQVTVPAPAPGLGHATELAQIDLRVLDHLPQLMGDDLKAWTLSVLKEMVDAGRLPREAIVINEITKKVDPRWWELIARTLEYYLSRSGKYTYSLQLDRANDKIDPTLDFLYNTKSGHCNRFASALALMLRSLEIPSQIVLGYRGADSRGEGNYDVRQCYAHSWVEVLVQREQPGPAHGMRGGELTWHWLSLDPTPMEASEEATAVGNRWWGAGLDLRKTYRNLIVNFSPENRDEFFNDVALVAKGLWSYLGKSFAADTPEGFRLRLATALFALVVVASLVHVVRLVRRRARLARGAPPSPHTAFYRRLLAILARHGWKPAAADTSREFADLIAQRVQSRNDGAEMADVIRQTSTLFDRVRFGNVPLNGDEATRVDARLEQLTQRLAARDN